MRGSMLASMLALGMIGLGGGLPIVRQRRSDFVSDSEHGHEPAADEGGAALAAAAEKRRRRAAKLSRTWVGRRVGGEVSDGQ